MKRIRRELAIVVVAVCIVVSGVMIHNTFFSMADNMEIKVEGLTVTVPENALAANVSSYLNIRYQPSSSATVIGKLVPGDVVLATGQNGEWTKIDVDGQVGYVYTKYTVTGTELKKYIQKNLKLFSVSAIQTDRAFQTVYSTKKAAKTDTVVCSMSAVVSTGASVYATKSTASKMKNEYVSVKKALVTTEGLRLRGKASTKGKIYKVLGKGTVLDLSSGGNKKWTKVRYNGKVGYVSSDYIKIVTKKENKSNVLKNLGKSRKFNVVDESKKWVTVNYNGAHAYVKRSYCKVTAKNASGSKKVVGFLENNVACSVENVTDSLAYVKMKNGTKGYVKSTCLTATIATTPIKLDQSAITAEQQQIVQSTVSLKDVSGVRKELVEYALGFVGGTYKWGGNSLTEGVDCSGFTQQIFAKYNVSLSRCSYEQACNGVEISFSQLQPGDLLFYYDTSLNRIGHVAIYIGDNQIVHAKSTASGITTSAWNYRTPYKAVNVLGDVQVQESEKGKDIKENTVKDKDTKDKNTKKKDN